MTGFTLLFIVFVLGAVGGVAGVATTLAVSVWFGAVEYRDGVLYRDADDIYILRDNR